MPFHPTNYPPFVEVADAPDDYEDLTQEQLDLIEQKWELAQQIGMSARYFLSLSKKEKKAFLKEHKKP